MLLLDWLNEPCARHAEAVAIDAGGDLVRYAELDARANQFASCLVANEVAPGSDVALLTSDRVELVAAMLGIFRAGCIFAPLDTGSPGQRLEKLLSRLSPRALVLGAGYEALAAQLFAGSDCPVIHTGAEGPAPELPEGLRPVQTPLAEASREPVGRALDPDAPAYVYFTSGSTGEPKGITGRLRSLSNFVEWEIQRFGIGAGFRVSQLTQPTFDAFFRDVLVTLCAGGTLCLPPQQASELAAGDLVAWLEQSGVQLVHCVPSLLATLFGESLRSDHFPSLEYVLLSGEVLQVAHARRFREIFGERVKLVNLYGASEATMIQLHHVVTAEDLARDFVPIGTPISGVEALLVNERGEACATGETGEIVIRSRFLTLGYRGDASATAAVFVPNPLTGDADDPCYRTGDLGERLRNGELRIHGRRDRQVKLRGIRVELGAIEAALLRHAEVTSCAVVLRSATRKNLIAKQGLEDKQNDAGESQRLVAYLVCRDAVSDASLRGHLESCLPAYMVPAQFVRLAALPQNANGKIDFGALPEPGGVRPELDVPFAAPEGELERGMAQIWEEILGVAPVGANDSFFDLGGDSLMAIQTLNRLRKVQGLRVKVRDLFERRTIRGLAEMLQAEGAEPDATACATTASVAAVLPTEERRSYPLSRAQQGLWFLWKMEPDNPYYTSQGTVYLRGSLDLPVFRRAFEALIARHQMLRVRFAVEQGLPVQIFEEDTGIEMPLEDLSRHTAEEQERILAEAVERESRRPFDLERERLIRFRLFKLSEQVHVLTTAVHEITVDLWSVRELMQDLSALYDGFLAGDENPLPPLPLSFGDFVLREQQELARENLAREEAYWKAQLAGELPVLALPVDHPRPKQPSYRGSLANVVLDAEVANGLRALSRDADATLFMTILSAFKVLLHRYTGQDDLIVGAPLSNRTDQDRERLVGFFLNMLPLRSDLSSDPSFRELLGRVKQTVTGAISNADYPFIWMLEWARAIRDTGSAPVFQVMFNMLSFTDVQLSKRDLEIAYRGHETGYTKYDISMYAQEVGEELFLQFSYQQDLFDPVTIERMLANLCVLLRAVVDDPDVPVSQIELVHEDERRVLDGWNDTQRDFDLTRSIASLFEAQAQATPEATAFFFEGESLSYAELDGRANQLAHELLRRGIGQGDLVGLCVERSFELLIAVLGILKTGAAYVPLDADYPVLRLHDMLADCKPVLLLTQKSRLPFEDYEGEKAHLEDVWKAIEEGPRTRPEVPTSARDLLCVVYTSATTGRPKGVAVGAEAVQNRLYWMWNAFPFQAGDVAVFHKSYALVASTWEMFGPLLRGVPSLIVGREAQLDPALFRRQVVDHEVTTLLATPALLEGVLGQSEGGAEPWDSLRLATTSAEPIPPAMVERWRRAFPGVPLLNLYGSTECSSNATVYDAARTPEDAERVPIGRPLANVQVHVLDRHQQPVPLGVAGEMCVSGACLSRGYLGLPELTAEKFATGPDGQILYHTGDVARVRSDGELELLGRMDNQIKLRGFRVDPGDVESTLLRHHAVSQCAVLLSDDDDDPRLVAYVVGHGEEPPGAELRAFLSERLPAYMIPSEFLALAELPLTANGKLERKALPRPERRRQTSGGYVAPRTFMEQDLAEIWQNALGLERIGVHDDFFELGGHSLLAVQTFSQIEARMGTELPLSTLFEAPTIEQLALRLTNEEQQTAESCIVTLQGEGAGTPIFLLPGAGGHAFSFRELARRLGTDQPCFGLHLTGLPTENGQPLDRIDAMATAFTKEILAHRPEGPFVLGGYSVGGQIAHEIARQLQARGHEVELLILIDSRLPGTKKQLPLPERLRLHWRKATRGGVAGLWRYLVARFENRLHSDESAPEPALDASSPLEAQIQRVMRASRRAGRTHRPGYFPGRALLFQTTPEMEFVEWEDPQNTWGPLVQQLDVVQLPGNHRTLFYEPNVGTLARGVRQQLERPRSESGV